MRTERDLVEFRETYGGSPPRMWEAVWVDRRAWIVDDLLRDLLSPSPHCAADAGNQVWCLFGSEHSDEGYHWHRTVLTGCWLFVGKKLPRRLLGLN